MARIRTVKPEIYQDEDLASVSESSFILAIGLLNHSDDEGYFKANPGLLKAAVFPLREPSVSIHDMLTELSNMGYIELFDGTDHKKYGKVLGFTRHQRINRPTESKIKELYKLNEGSLNTHVGITEDSPPERKGKEGKGKEQGKECNVKQAKEIIDYLNSQAGRNYQHSETNIDLVKARLKEGNSVDHCKQVIDRQIQEWKDDPVMYKFLRPATLFNKTKFSQYSGEVFMIKPKSKPAPGSYDAIMDNLDTQDDDYINPDSNLLEHDSHG